MNQDDTLQVVFGVVATVVGLLAIYVAYTIAIGTANPKDEYAVSGILTQHVGK